MNKDPKTLTHHLIFSRAALIIRLWRTHNKNLPNWIIPMSDEQGNDLLSRMKSQQKLVHLDLSKWQTTAKNNWSRLADKRSPLLISFFSLSTSVIPCFSNFPWHCRVFGFIEIWRQSVRSTAKLIGRGQCSSNYRWSPICQKSHMARHPIALVGVVLDQESRIPLKI